MSDEAIRKLMDLNARQTAALECMARNMDKLEEWIPKLVGQLVSEMAPRRDPVDMRPIIGYTEGYPVAAPDWKVQAGVPLFGPSPNCPDPEESFANVTCPHCGRGRESRSLPPPPG